MIPDDFGVSPKRVGIIAFLFARDHITSKASHILFFFFLFLSKLGRGFLFLSKLGMG